MSDPNFVDRTAQISWEIREALRKALPAPMEQFFTVMVPGKVVNFDDFTEGFDVNGKPNTIVLPTVTELNQAILCDDMPVLAPVQLGPTGKSVSRSYDAAISKLIPAGTTVGVDVADPNNLSVEEERYRKAMEWLTYSDPDLKGQTRVELYGAKQESYTKAVEAKTKAFNDALKRAQDDPSLASKEEKRAAYDVWVSENARTYRNYMQAKYMDWVVIGKKEEVEYWFSIVDRDSAMSRVESSKEAMRAAVVQDSDGSVEYQKVKLTPSNWAVIAKKKALSGQNQIRTVEWYTWEITRLQRMNALIKALQSKPINTSDKKTVSDGDDAAVIAAMTKLITARNAYQNAEADSTVTAEAKKQAYNDYQAAKGELSTAESKSNSSVLDKMNADSFNAQLDMYDRLQGDSGIGAATLTANIELIAQYTIARQALLDKQGNEGGLLDEIEGATDVPKKQRDPEAQQGPDEQDYFTAITIEIASSHSQDSSYSHSSSASFGASVGWGWWSASANASYSESTAETASEMANNTMKISFECMRVDIQRSWLRAELFYDADLTTGPDEFISPGFTRLRALMEQSADLGLSPEAIQIELDRYGTFPLYPTSFLLAANVVLEITGETTKTQTYFHESATKAGGSFGYGPFKMSASYASESQASEASCDTTADGLRITLKSPQIIGWISQMVPALPRLRNQALPNKS